MESDFNYQLVPYNYTHCFNEKCTRSSQCLLHLVAESSTSQHSTLKIINPKCIPVDTAGCPYFKRIRKIRMAWGIKNLLDNVPHKVAGSMRSQFIGHFGRNNYYYFYRLERALRPEEQEYIRHVFRENGIAEEPAFERYTDEYDFKW